MSDMFSENVQEYFKYLYKRNMSVNTIKTYNESMIRFIQFLKSKEIDVDLLKMDDINSILIENYMDFLKINKNENATINLRLNSIKSFFKYIQNRNLKYINLCETILNIKELNAYNKIPAYLIKEELDILFKCFDVKKDYDFKALTICSIAYDGALRSGDICNLKLKNITLENEYATLTLVHRKGNKEHKVIISKNSTKILIKYLDKFNINELEEYVFKNKFNDKYTNDGLNDLLKKYYNKAKQSCKNKTLFQQEHISFHMLRHSRGVILADNGINIIDIRDIMGHTSINTTEKYAKISNSTRKEIVDNEYNSIKLPKSYSKREQYNLENWLKNDEILYGQKKEETSIE